jgi:hypothetical protein
MNGHCCLQLFYEPLPFCFSPGCIGSGRSVRKFDQGNHTDGDFSFRDSLRDLGEQLPGVLAVALGGDKCARVED